MPIIDINLLAKQQGTVSRLNQANFVVAVAAGVVIGLLLLIVVFLYSTIGIRTAEKNNAISQTQDFQHQIADLDKQTDNTNYPNMNLSQQAKAYQSQVDTLGKLIDNHRYFSLYISEIAQNTPNESVYKSFSSDQPERLTIAGRAVSYGDAAKLAERFKGLSFAKDASIQEAKYDPRPSGGNDPLAKFPITFLMVIDLKSAADLNKLPGPIPRTGETAPSPAPRASGEPSPGASIGPLPGGVR
jgi:hypothetical protein